jgi:hypothetical protein
MNFTHKEKTVKDKTVGMAYGLAKSVVTSKFPDMKICINALRGRSDDQPITTEELSNLVEQIVDDSLFYGGKWIG